MTTSKALVVYASTIKGRFIANMAIWRVARFPLVANYSVGLHVVKKWFLPVSILALACCTLLFETADASSLSATDKPICIEHVTIHPMTEAGSALSDMTVQIKDGRIANVLPTAAGGGPKGSPCVNARGVWLMPALTDMHVHQENPRVFNLFLGANSVVPAKLDNRDVLLPFIANGVLQIFNPAAMAEEIGLRDDIEAGRVLGPHIELAAMVDGAHPIWPLGFSHVAATPEDGRQFVRDMKADGFSFVKTYSKLDLATFTAIIAEAHEQGIRVVGHIPGRGQGITEKWLQPGYEMVMHAEEFAYQSKDLANAASQIKQYVALAKDNGVLLTATLTTNERIVEQIKDHDSLGKRSELKYVHPVTRLFWSSFNPYVHVPPADLPNFEQIASFNKTLTKAFADAGITVFPGTDSLVPGMIAGFSLHDELEALARAGLSAAQILTADTRLAANWLGVGADRGTVEIGKRADLLLLSADPMIDVANTRRIVAVIRNGQYLSRARLDRMMSELAERYSRMTPPSAPTPSASSGGGGYFGYED